MKFNINNYIRVKLTDYGRQVDREHHDAIFANYGTARTYRPPTEDADGWSQWQAHAFMSIFGQHMHCGSQLVCETDIEIVEPNDLWYLDDQGRWRRRIVDVWRESADQAKGGA